MSNQKHPAWRHGHDNVDNQAEFGDDEIEPTKPGPDEMRRLEERLEELRAEGILSGATEPRQLMKPVAHIPGALERFIADRD